MTTGIEAIGSPFNLNRTGLVVSDEESGGVLAQEDFLTLLTTQLQNQDPLSPMDNAEFLSQMAQFSTVEGIEQVNETLAGFEAVLGSNRVATAASLLGHSVLVPGAVARPDTSGEVHGMFELDTGASAITITYSDAETDALLQTQSLGGHSSGWVSFGWEDLPPEITNDRRPVRVQVTAETADGRISVPANVFARVTSALGGPSTDTITLQVEDYGVLDSDEVSAFR